tara:strand:+ start:2097 stop:2393 length:297 start_codon:yes stop_codon:yes gene_type:complete
MQRSLNLINRQIKILDNLIKKSPAKSGTIKMKTEVKVVSGILAPNLVANLKGKLYLVEEIMKGDYKYLILQNEGGIRFGVKASDCEIIKEVKLKTKKK